MVDELFLGLTRGFAGVFEGVFGGVRNINFRDDLVGVMVLDCNWNGYKMRRVE